MRTITVLSGVALVLAGTAGVASCVASTEPAPGAVEAKDDDPFGADPDFGDSVAAPPPPDVTPAAPTSSGGSDLASSSSTPHDDDEQAFWPECKTACLGGPRAMTAWCTLLRYHPDPGMERTCWDHVNSPKLVCVAWCARMFLTP